MAEGRARRFPIGVPLGLRLALGSVWLFSAPLAGAEVAALRAGAARVEIAAPADGPLAGYGARGPGNAATHVLDPVSARALVVEAPAGPRVALLALDLLIVTPGLRSELEAATAHLELDTLLVAATHTHSGPGGYENRWVSEAVILGWHRAESREALLAAAVRALEEAAAALRPARLRTARAEAPELSRNRRHADGPSDPGVPILLVDAAAGGSIATLFAFAAHPTVLSPANLGLSPDYPGAARRTIETARGGVAIFLAGPLGDQKPHLEGEPDWPEDVARQARNASEIGRRLGERVVAASAGARPAGSVLAARTDAWELPPIDVRNECAWHVGAPLLNLVARRFFPERAPIVALRLGTLRILGSPFELGVEVAAALREAYPGPPLLVAAHAGDWLGYLLQPEDFDSGGYEPCMAFHGRDVAPGFVERAAELLRSLD